MTPDAITKRIIRNFYPFSAKLLDTKEFQVSRGKDNKFYFNLTQKNGIESEIENSSDKKHFEGKDSKSGQFYFVLKAANSKVIGMSQMYTTHDSAENGIESIKTNARLAEINYLYTRYCCIGHASEKFEN